VHADVVTLQMAVMLVLGGAALVVANLAVLRDRRHRTDAVSDILVLPASWRTGAFLLAVLASGRGGRCRRRRRPSAEGQVHIPLVSGSVSRVGHPVAPV
jgi:hypothetical protein